MSLTQPVIDQLQRMLDEYSGTSSGEGAVRIGVEDSAANFTATDVEGVLAELSISINPVAESLISSRGIGVTGTQAIGHSLGLVPKRINAHISYDEINGGSSSGTCIVTSGPTFIQACNMFELSTSAQKPDVFDGAMIYVQFNSGTQTFTGTVTAASTTDITITWALSGADWSSLNIRFALILEA